MNWAVFPALKLQISEQLQVPISVRGGEAFKSGLKGLWG